MEAFFTINWLAFAACFGFSVILGIIWYHPRVFGGIWANAIGLQDGDLDVRAKTRSLISGMVYNALSLYGLAVLLSMLTLQNVWQGVAAGSLIAIFLAIAPMGNLAAFEQWRASRIIVHGGYRLVLFAASGTLLAWWR